MRRAAFGLLGLSALVGLGMAGGVGPARALSQPSETVSRHKALVKDYPALTGQFPSQPNPTQCLAANFCDVIPLDVQVPTDIAPGDDFVLKVIVSWEDVTDDLDMYLFDDGQTQQEKDQNGGGDPASGTPSAGPSYTQKASATNGEGQMDLTLAEPRLGKYNLVVNHYLGNNTGYHVDARIIVAGFKRPFESLEPPPPSVTEDNTAPPVDTSGQPVSGDPTAPAGVFGAPARLDDVHPLVDSDLDNLFKAKGAVSATNVSGVLPTATAKPPVPPSGIALLFWLAVVPGSLLGGLAFWLVKRRRATFTFG
ncbi:MAG TPA: hypothetical protein VGO92_09420 [Acidimicrobiales bacterium]|jgi:hypothetical protein|nr:hypothetical protein [Acidimicrobiales bacterium]